ncbi:Uncharacterised protein [Brucella neotomae]|nr:Uncharacterised protein [Brucella neotomae]
MRQAFQRVDSRFACGTVMPDCGKIAQRLKKGRRKKKNKQPLTKRQLVAPGAELQRAEQMETDIDRHHCHAKRRKKLQHSRGKKGDPQHRHGFCTQGFSVFAQAFCRHVNGVEGADRGEPAQPVEQKAIHAAKRHKLFFACSLRAPANQRHENRDQRRGDQQDERRHP